MARWPAKEAKEAKAAKSESKESKASGTAIGVDGKGSGSLIRDKKPMFGDK